MSAERVYTFKYGSPATGVYADVTEIVYSSKWLLERLSSLLKKI